MLACENCCAYAVKAVFSDAAADTVRFGLPPLALSEPDALLSAGFLPPPTK